MRMEWKYSNEVSSFFLFEASGDSEGDFNHLVSSAHHDNDDDDDDAMSCSCDSTELLGFHGDINNLTEVDQFCIDHVHDGGDDDTGGHDHRTVEILPREEGEEESKGGGVNGRVEKFVTDMVRHKVIVTGRINPEKVLKKLRKKTGKKVEIMAKKEDSKDPPKEEDSTIDGIPTHVMTRSMVLGYCGDSDLYMMFSDENANACSIM
ncbi:hypothetical protein Vadar_033065 [Vaccinium darrowii]|uniref:Uncharacterized protein n=1 Tax=Vaccinium darrowii TaxID=229202 RepID=A0ACB7Z272_9ERIC|nr:hypothetical protein Vadar_033065 [Vaccinium darrowii]